MWFAEHSLLTRVDLLRNGDSGLSAISSVSGGLNTLAILMMYRSSGRLKVYIVSPYGLG